MIPKPVKVAAACAAAVVVAVLIALIARGLAQSASTSPRHATCWAHPGVIGYAGPHHYIPVYTSLGTRHGAGPAGSNICNN